LTNTNYSVVILNIKMLNTSRQELPVVICFVTCGGCIQIVVSIPYGLIRPRSVNVLAWLSVTGHV